MIRVAVSYQDGEIFEHFGHTETFAIYEFDEENLEESTKRGVDAVICGSMGPEAHAALLGYGIIPVAGYCGDADTAAQLLVIGQLPTSDGGGCSGGCGGCSGCHGGGEEGEGGCDCGCGC